MKDEKNLPCLHPSAFPPSLGQEVLYDDDLLDLPAAGLVGANRHADAGIAETNGGRVSCSLGSSTTPFPSLSNPLVPSSLGQAWFLASFHPLFS